MKTYIVISVVLFGFGFFSCKKQDDTYAVNQPGGVNLKDVIAFTSVSANTVAADDVSSSAIEVKINPAAAADNRDVVFTATGGHFTNGDTIQIVHANAEGFTSVSLLSNSVQSIRVRAMVLTYAIDTTIVYTAALPDDLLLTAESYVADTATSIHVSTQLFRNPGRGEVSDPVKVIYNLSYPDSSTGLVYPQFTYSAEHTATIMVTNPYHATGDFIITSKVLSATGDTLSKSVTIQIK